MIVYSKTIHAFTKKWEAEAKKILSNEMGLTVRRTRFEYKRYLYPIHLVVIQSRTYLGSFDAKNFQIALNESLLYESKDSVIRDILRHELAHYICHLKYGDDSSMHGENFQRICQEAGWKKNISMASMNLVFENENRVGELANEKILMKVKKLLTLSNSPNTHEAELATLKANEILLKYNIENLNIDDDKKYYVKEVMQAKRKNATMDTVYSILSHFMVRPIFKPKEKGLALEVTGTLDNVELADYIASFLCEKLPLLWKESGLKGLRAKNSFYAGIAHGYNDKMQGIETAIQRKYSQELVLIHQHLDLAFNSLYGKTRSVSSSSRTDYKSFSSGREKGKTLNINKAMKNKSSQILLLGS
jgi:hypothetical protein